MEAEEQCDDDDDIDFYSDDNTETAAESLGGESRSENLSDRVSTGSIENISEENRQQEEQNHDDDKSNISIGSVNDNDGCPENLNDDEPSESIDETNSREASQEQEEQRCESGETSVEDLNAVVKSKSLSDDDGEERSENRSGEAVIESLDSKSEETVFMGWNENDVCTDDEVESDDNELLHDWSETRRRRRVSDTSSSQIDNNNNHRRPLHHRDEKDHYVDDSSSFVSCDGNQSDASTDQPEERNTYFLGKWMMRYEDIT